MDEEGNWLPGAHDAKAVHVAEWVNIWVAEEIITHRFHRDYLCNNQSPYTAYLYLPHLAT